VVFKKSASTFHIPRSDVIDNKIFMLKQEVFSNASLFRGKLPAFGQACWRKSYSGNITLFANQKDDPVEQGLFYNGQCCLCPKKYKPSA